MQKNENSAFIAQEKSYVKIEKKKFSLPTKNLCQVFLMCDP